jgi:hypothetical protein
MPAMWRDFSIVAKPFIKRIAARSGFSGPAAPEYDVAVRMGVADAFCRKKRRSEEEGERKKLGLLDSGLG